MQGWSWWLANGPFGQKSFFGENRTREWHQWVSVDHQGVPGNCVETFQVDERLKIRLMKCTKVIPNQTAILSLWIFKSCNHRKISFSFFLCLHFPTDKGKKLLNLLQMIGFIGQCLIFIKSKVTRLTFCMRDLLLSVWTHIKTKRR